MSEALGFIQPFAEAQESQAQPHIHLHKEISSPSDVSKVDRLGKTSTTHSGIDTSELPSSQKVPSLNKRPRDVTLEQTTIGWGRKNLLRGSVNQNPSVKETDG